MENEKGEKVEFEECLINAVRERKFLYDKTDASYKDRNKKRNAWAEIAAGLEVSAEEASKLWKVLRGQYTTYLAKLKKPSGSAAGLLPRFRHSQTMEFYQEFYKNYRSGSNLEEEDSRDIGEGGGDACSMETSGDGEPGLDVEYENFDDQNPPPPVVRDNVTPGSAPKVRFSKKRRAPDEVEERLIAALESSTPTADEFDHFGANVACRLRKINAKNPIYASKLQLDMQEMLYSFEEALSKRNDDD